MIVVAGSANTDLVARVAHHPEPGETLLAGDYAVHQGGKGANQAVAAARLGVPVRFVGAVGTDDFGHGIVEALDGEGIDTACVRRVDGNSGLALITVDTQGENSIVVVPGANGRLEAADVGTACADAQVVLVQLETPPAFINAALDAGRRAGAQTILNAAPAASLQTLDMQAVDWLLVNAGEAAQLLNESRADDVAGVERQARRLREQHDVGVVVTLGADGALWLGRDGASAREPGQRCDVVDTTGAGDTFAGAFACARARGHGVARATAMATRAGSLSVQGEGARVGMPTRAQLAAAMAETSP